MFEGLKLLRRQMYIYIYVYIYIYTNTYTYTCVCVCVYIYIQGDSGGICSTLENDSMSDSKQKSSYEHVSDFERLRSYGHFLIPVHDLM